jgi:hypothetical protein
MFKGPKATVFILGAGASWHYGYPTGETLVKKVIEKAKIASRFFEHSAKLNNSILPKFVKEIECESPMKNRDRWQHAWRNCEKLKTGMEGVNPLVIDYFLGWNPDVRDIGKLLIAWVILECEQKAKTERWNANRIGVHNKEYNDDWCRFIIHQLAMHCEHSSDLLKNKVSFVTFNYDVSLETALRDGLGHIQLFDAEDIEKFLGGSRIVHVYGKVRNDTRAPTISWKCENTLPDAVEEFNLSIFGNEFKELLDHIYEASKGLRVIDPVDKMNDSQSLTLANTQIASAGRVYLLGYGFDEHNSERLSLFESLAQASPQKNVSFTNFGDISKVNKRASAIFFGNRGGFPSGGPSVMSQFEKSVRNVYDALNLDFDIE